MSRTPKRETRPAERLDPFLTRFWTTSRRTGRKIIKTRGHFPTDEAATKLIWLALRNITATWSHPAHQWRAALNQFAILYEDRFLKGPVA